MFDDMSLEILFHDFSPRFGVEERFERQNATHVASMAQATYMNEATNKWAQALSTQWGCLCYFVFGVIAVALAHFGLANASQVARMGCSAANWAPKPSAACPNAA